LPAVDHHPALTLVLALAVGIFAQSVSRHLRIPGIVLLLLAGACLGPDGLGWIDPRSLGLGLVAVVELAVAVILFEGGLNLEISRLKREQTPIRRLVRSQRDGVWIGPGCGHSSSGGWWSSRGQPWWDR